VIAAGSTSGRAASQSTARIVSSTRTPTSVRPTTIARSSSGM